MTLDWRGTITPNTTCSDLEQRVSAATLGAAHPTIMYVTDAEMSCLIAGVFREWALPGATAIRFEGGKIVVMPVSGAAERAAETSSTPRDLGQST
jgi:hypothetical protein